MAQALRGLSFAIIALTAVSSCGAPPADTGIAETTTQAVTEPYVCYNGYNPLAQPWPARGVCEWKPSPNCPTCDNYPGVSKCFAQGPDWGQIYIYSGDGNTLDCTAVWTGLYADHAVFLFQDLAKFGWNALKPTTPGALGATKRIRSYAIGGMGTWAPDYALSTKVQFWSDPKGPAADSGGYLTTTNATAVPVYGAHWTTYALPANWDVLSFEIWANHSGAPF